MIPNASDSDELLLYAVAQGLYSKMVLQLRKDFERANVAIVMPEGITPVNLVAVLHEKIYVLLMEQFTEYLNLLYVIDVPEQSFKEVEITDAVEVSKDVSFLVLKRIWQKVWSKSTYDS